MMRQQRFLIITSIITCYLLQAQGADKYTDENRPYEFGFTIDGQQHRHEEKDKNGIIKGEYGFITADGVYHITVYATDEQGRFKILSMKNIRYTDYVKGLPGPSSSPRQGHSLQLPSSQAMSTNAIPAPTQKPQQELKPISIEPPANSCSHCSLPTTSTAAPKIDTPLVNQQSSAGDNQYNPSFYPKQDTFDTQSAQSPREPSYPGTQINSQQGFAQGPAQSGYNGVQNLGQQPHAPAQANAYNGVQGSAQIPNQSGEQNGNFGTPNGLQGPQGYGSQNGLSGGQQGLQQIENARSGKQYTDTPGSSASPQAGQSPNQKPVLAYAQMQIVDKNTDIYAKAPGEKDGLPPGFKEDDMLKLLYTFNYTLGFQAHFEEGFANGVKRGYYYSTGRNGVRTRIDYVADKDGFHPTLSQEVYDLLSEDVPKEETEKEEKYGLKGYEFKWLYFPVETKGQHNAR